MTPFNRALTGFGIRGSGGRVLVIEKHVSNVQLLLPFRSTACVFPDCNAVFFCGVAQTRIQPLIERLACWFERYLNSLISHVFSTS